MKRCFGSGVLGAFAALSAAAAPIGADTFDSQYRVVVPFETLPDDYRRPGPLDIGGVRFEAGGGFLRTYPAAPPSPLSPLFQVCAERGCIMTDNDLDTITVTLPQAVTMVGAYLGIPNISTTATATFYAGATALGTVSIAAQRFQGVFAGWNAGAPLITSVTFADTDAQGYMLALSGLTYQVAAIPEARSGWLALAGLVLLWLATRAPQRTLTDPRRQPVSAH